MHDGVETVDNDLPRARRCVGGWTRCSLRTFSNASHSRIQQESSIDGPNSGRLLMKKTTDEGLEA